MGYLNGNIMPQNVKKKTAEYWRDMLPVVDAVIANPPWSSEKIYERTDLTAAGFSLISGQNDSYVLFMELAYNILRADGLMAFIIPDSSLEWNREEKILIQLVLSNLDMWKFKVYNFIMGNAQIHEKELEAHEAVQTTEVRCCHPGAVATGWLHTTCSGNAPVGRGAGKNCTVRFIALRYPQWQWVTAPPQNLMRHPGDLARVVLFFVYPNIDKL